MVPFEPGCLQPLSQSFFPRWQELQTHNPPSSPPPSPKENPIPALRPWGENPFWETPCWGCCSRDLHKHAHTSMQPQAQFSSRGVLQCPSSQCAPVHALQFYLLLLFFFYLTTSHKSEIPFRPGKVAVTFLKRNETRPAVSTLVITCYRVAPIKHLGPHLSFLPLPVGISGSSSPWLTHRIIMIQIALL